MRPRLTYANVVASLALFTALGGTSFAAIQLTSANVRDGSLTGRDVKDGSLRSRDVRNETVTSRDVRDHSPRARDFRRGVLPMGPGGIPGPGAAGLNQNISLFSVIGLDYGGNGATTFKLPDLTAASPKGASPHGVHYVI